MLDLLETTDGEFRQVLNVRTGRGVLSDFQVTLCRWVEQVADSLVVDF